MASSSESDVLTPEEAFGLLGNEIRIGVLQALAEDEPRRFSDLRAAVGVEDSGQFNYHLDQLTGHFVVRNGDGYRLRQPGRRVIQAVLSGAVTESPHMDVTPIDWGCHLCGAEPIEIDYRDEQVGVYCRECEGIYGGDRDATLPPAARERLYYMHLPPAGMAGRSPEEVYLAASRWTNAETVTAALGICPRCSARQVESATVCRNHAATDGRCERCDNQFGVTYRTRCTNCPYELESLFVNKLLTNLEFRTFLIDQGLNPVFPQRKGFLDILHHFEEDVRSVDPLEVTFTFFGDEETISLTVDDSLAVVEVERS